MIDFLGRLHRLFDNPTVFALSQPLGRGTVEGYRALLEEHLHTVPSDTVLDIGCGIGAFSGEFNCQYYGVDNNNQYIEAAKRRFRRRFKVMHCTALNFPDNHFDHVVSIAVFHHLNDRQVHETLKEALRVCRKEGAVHVIDAIFPLDESAWLKRRIFLADRGRHQRSFEGLRELVERDFRVTVTAVCRTFPHDSCYIRINHPPGNSGRVTEAKPPRAE